MDGAAHYCRDDARDVAFGACGVPPLPLAGAIAFAGAATRFDRRRADLGPTPSYAADVAAAPRALPRNLGDDGEIDFLADVAGGVIPTAGVSAR